MISTIGSLLLAFCALPEAIKTYRTKRCYVGWPMMWAWFTGEVLLVIFALQTNQHQLLLNYFANIAFVVVMAYYKVYGEKA